MDGSSIVSIVVALLSVAGVYIANRYTSKSAQAAQETTQQIEMAKLETARTEGWRADNIELRKQREEDRKTYESNMREIVNRVEMLELDQKVSQRERQSIVAWARRIVDLLKESGIPYPPPPPGIMDTDPGIPRIQGN